MRCAGHVRQCTQRRRRHAAACGDRGRPGGSGACAACRWRRPRAPQCAWPPSQGHGAGVCGAAALGSSYRKVQALAWALPAPARERLLAFWPHEAARIALHLPSIAELCLCVGCTGNLHTAACIFDILCAMLRFLSGTRAFLLRAALPWESFLTWVPCWATISWHVSFMSS